MAGKNVVSVNDLNFEDEVVKSDQPVLVDFTATWCGPCRQIAPLVDQLADEYDGKAKVAKLDIDESPETARRFQIRGVPTILIFKGGEVVDQQVGLAPKTILASKLDGAM
ncbi:MAG: thioredoxin [Sandaracinaceae bacterium]|nr:MAG: thioredoxin [Sandaracinaceae bacterium]HBQ10512.1 thioredoxin [Myxococcales bacterium]